MPRRSLRFQNYEQVLVEAERLNEMGYEPTGNWSLAQVCHHLSMVMEYSLDGFPKQQPWLFRWIARRFFLPRVLKHQVIRGRAPAGAALQPPDSPDAPAALARLHKAIDRLKNHKGELAPSPAFGPLTPDEWREVHLWHCEHHLGFLAPKGA